MYMIQMLFFIHLKSTNPAWLSSACSKSPISSCSASPYDSMSEMGYWVHSGIQDIVEVLQLTVLYCRMSGCKVYVGRLASDAREKDVERFFKGYGRLRDVSMKNGYGFVVSSLLWFYN